jgi:acyl-CoA reductase-like NAD-dependent aldehyde dehydrogenase
MSHRYAHRPGRDLRPGDFSIPAKSLDEAIEIANGVQYGLSAAIYTQDVNRAFHAMNDIYTGHLST